jgi:hypothetical protein
MQVASQVDFPGLNDEFFKRICAAEQEARNLFRMADENPEKILKVRNMFCPLHIDPRQVAVVAPLSFPCCR